MATNLAATQKRRLKQLQALVAYHQERYHRDDAPEISDAAYDALVRELALLETALFVTNKTSEKIGGGTNAAFQKVTHTVPQWSFDNVFSEEEFTEWVNRARRYLGDVDARFAFVAEHKIDGLKLIVTYREGQLVQAVTRGDGVVGEDVTHTARTIVGLPETLQAPVSLTVMGEVWLPRTQLSLINETRAAAGEPLFANPRNAAAGTLRQLDPTVAAARGLRFYAYDADAVSVVGTNYSLPTTQDEELTFLKKLGLPVNDTNTVCTTIAAVVSTYKKWLKQRSTFEHDLDGVVIKINDLQQQQALGYTAKAPRYGVAFKFPAEQVTTIVTDITLQVGRTGVVTPVAELTPVLVAGSTVARATLHNEDFIQEKDIRIGDTVIIQKAGDVIPEVVMVLTDLRPARTRRYQFPSHVAGCGGDGAIVRLPGEAAYRCVVLDSPDIIKERLSYAVGKNALNIDGMGPKVVAALYDAGHISSIADVFHLTTAELATIPKFKEKSIDNTIAAIKAAKTQPLSRVLVALGIREVGEETARLLASSASTLRDVFTLPRDTIVAIHGIGEVVADALAAWWEIQSHQTVVTELEKVLTIIPEAKPASTVLTEEVIVVTGTLPTYSRDAMHDLIRQHGGTVGTSVTSATTRLIAGEAAGSKITAAKARQLPIMTESDFVAWLASLSK